MKFRGWSVVELNGKLCGNRANDMLPWVARTRREAREQCAWLRRNGHLQARVVRVAVTVDVGIDPDGKVVDEPTE